MINADLELRVTRLEKHYEESNQIVSSAIKELHLLVNTLSRGLSSQDLTLAAVRHLLVAKEILSEDEISERIDSLVEMIRRRNKELQETPGLSHELKKVEEAACKDNTSPHPPEAFIFGG